MSDLWTSPSDEEKAASRRHAVWGLLLLVATAVVIIALMLLVFGRSPTGRGSEAASGAVATTETTQPAVGASGAPARISARSSVPPRSLSTSPRPQETSTANPCPSTAPCAVGGGDAGVVAALNGFRTSHGRAAVPGATSSQAQQCALSQGDGPSCAPHYAWQPVTGHDGAMAISMIAGRGDGAQWLLDPDMKTISVGWAYVPGGAGSPGQYECAILKIG
jgi:hypothetical protein